MQPSMIEPSVGFWCLEFGSTGVWGPQMENPCKMACRGAAWTCTQARTEVGLCNRRSRCMCRRYPSMWCIACFALSRHFLHHFARSMHMDVHGCMHGVRGWVIHVFAHAARTMTVYAWLGAGLAGVGFILVDMGGKHRANASWMQQTQFCWI